MKIKMTMTPEKIFQEQVWEILQDLKEEFLVTVQGGPVKYRIPSIVGVGIIPPDRRTKILFKLEEKGVLKIHRNSDGARFGSSDLYYLFINEDQFNEEYNNYKKLIDKSNDSSASNLSDKASVVVEVPAKIVISDLNSKYSEIEGENDAIQFYMKIAQYGKYILENPVTALVLDPLYQESRDDAKVYLKDWRDFVKTWRGYAEDLIEKAEAVGIKDNPKNPLDNEISSIKNRLSIEDTSVWESDLSDYFLPYQTLIWKFSESDKTKHLIPKHLDPENKAVVIYQIYDNARNEWDKFKYSRETKVWWAHYQISRLAAGVLDLSVKQDYFKKDDIIDGFYKYEFNEIAKGNINRNPIMLHKDKYLIWIKRLHDYLLPRLENLQDSSPTQIREATSVLPQVVSAETRINKRFIKKIVSEVKKTADLGRKEKSLLTILSDLEPHKTSELSSQVPTKAYRKLKESLSKKIRNAGLIIETFKGTGLNPSSFYKLNYLPQ